MITRLEKSFRTFAPVEYSLYNQSNQFNYEEVYVCSVGCRRSSALRKLQERQEPNSVLNVFGGRRV